MLLELFPFISIFYSPEDKGGGADDDTEDPKNKQEEPTDDDDDAKGKKKDDESDDDFDKPLALETIRKQREEFRDLKKNYRELEKSHNELKKSIEDKEKSDLELAQQGKTESDARASKAEAALKDERLRSAIIRASAVAGMRDPEDAYLQLRDSKDIEWEDEEYPFTVDSESVKNAVEALKEDKPYLFDEKEQEQDDDDPGGSPLHKRVRSRIKAAERDKKKAERSKEKEKPEVVVADRF